ncbi:sensor domain-containing diguanylate cyclase [Pseudoalteromonas citrea]|uniref:diguanylate cyclase n=1 Tax=Pseudoalteromonas citrea TaxID=43655 RepID=A0A5S3XSX5_9GAMM|nr:sensor domain-containing diguanylate cyclase [Pseudoalteromonas citrea]TMP45177.1 sensor domain-containing diguanylate cyclase [Pseudoalteromonas citrea]TMP61442.1 sensor domain-containing diguanylate cyclase [Pseudoalteromonas citrea]
MLNDLSEVTQRLRRVCSQEVDVSGSYQAFLQDIIDEGRTTLAVSRVSVWLFDDHIQPRFLLNVANTDWSTKVEQMDYAKLSLERYHAYFTALKNGESIAACDAETDPRTAEFSDDYLKPYGITTMLDTVIFKNGVPHGIVCCEGSDGPRQWQNAEVSYAEMIADCCSRRILVSELWALQQQLSDLAFQDALTGLKNRRYLMDYAEREISRHMRAELPLSMVVVDIDHFKSINDTYGHEVGDIVLQAFAGCCKLVLRTEDCLCRLGGEEFVAMLPHTNADNAYNVAQRLREALSQQQIEYGSERIMITVSCGVAEVNLQLPFSQSLKLADHAVYQAKAQGRNCVVRS